MVYRNTKFDGKRNYECTNVVACTVVDDNAKIPDGYEEAETSVLFGLRSLWIEGGIRYWGWL